MTATQAPRRAAKEIGRDRRRKEDQRLITGRTRWTDNIQLPGMLHVMVRSPFAHATITNIDAEAAKASPNVVTVITGRDVADEQGALPNAWPITPEQVTPNHPPIAVERATFAGEIVAVVAAQRRRRATRPSSWTSTTTSCPRRSTSRSGGQREGGRARAPRPRHQQVRVLEVRLGRGRHRWQRRRGDREGPRRWHRARAGVPPAAPDPGLHGAPLHGGRPHRRADHDVVGQIPHILRFLLAAVTGVSESKIRVVAPDVGGGFGGKLQTTPEEFITFLLARRRGKPVKYTETRSEC